MANAQDTNGPVDATEPVPAPAGGFGPVLKNRSFLVMWLGQVFSQTADKLVFILLVSIVTDLNVPSRVMSTSLAIHASPSVLLGALAGVLVDRHDKRRVMIVTNVLRALFVMLLGAFGHHSVVIAVALAFAVSCCAQPFIPAEGAAIPLVVGKTHLLAANSLFATTMIGSIIVAFTLGEPLIQWLGSPLAALVVGGTFLISVGFLFFVRYRDPDQRAAEPAPFWTQLKEGLRYAWESLPIRRTLAQQTALFGMFAAMSVLAIIFARQELHTNFSWFLATAGAGLGAGAWGIGHFGGPWNKNRLVVGGFLASGTVLATLAFLGAQQKSLAFGVAFLLGLASAFVAVPLQTRLQELVPEDLRGKIFGAQNMVLNIATTLPIAAVGFMVDGLGIRSVLGLTAGLMLAAGGLTWWTFRGERQAPPSA